MAEKALPPVKWQFTVSLDELLEANGMAGLNELLDDDLNSSHVPHYATDLSYEVVGVTGDGQILIDATYVPVVEVDGDDDPDGVDPPGTR